MNLQRQTLRLGTRGSALAIAQSTIVADQLRSKNESLQVELVKIETTGDRVKDRPLHEFGGKGVFTREIELALLCGEIDCAVHSLKDMPVTMPLVDDANLVIGAILERGDVHDVLVSAKARSIEDLDQGATVGSSSLRRMAQLLDWRPDLKVIPLRGNIDTRVRKLMAGEFDAIILAAAGLERLGIWDDRIMSRLDLFKMLPAAGQGALAVQCRRDDRATAELLQPIDHPATRRCVEIEREVVLQLKCDCHSPVGVYVEFVEQGFARLEAVVAYHGGSPPLVYVDIPYWNEDTIASEAVRRLCQGGAIEMLHPS